MGAISMSVMYGQCDIRPMVTSPSSTEHYRSSTIPISTNGQNALLYPLPDEAKQSYTLKPRRDLRSGRPQK